MMKPCNILIYVHEPSGYGDWCTPELYARDLPSEIEKYIVNGSEQKGKQKYVLTDFYTPAYNSDKARLYVPVGSTAQDSGLRLIPALKIVAG